MVMATRNGVLCAPAAFGPLPTHPHLAPFWPPCCFLPFRNVLITRAGVHHARAARGGLPLGFCEVLYNPGSARLKNRAQNIPH